MKIILFRHGEKQKVDSINIDDKRAVNLTDFGIIQINKLGKILLERFPMLNLSKVIYSSPYTRAIQSSEIIKSILNIKNIVMVPEFGEFYASNNYQKPKEIRQQIQEMAMQNPGWISPETNSSLNDEILKFKNKIKEICLKNQDDLILISTHGGIIRNTVYSLEPRLRPDNNVILDSKIHEAGYTVLDFDGKDFKVKKFDVHDYLD
ncbi:MAG TPA: histidine phosphatase family protein [Candidatus Woesebacteria bacterium]|nr:histidine phosphatase family protein [Candidatus Woesebacteria bacterium]